MAARANHYFSPRRLGTRSQRRRDSGFP